MSFDTVEENRAFAEKFSFPYPLLCDVDREIGMAYGACSKKTQASAMRITYLIGIDQKIRRVWLKVDTKTHSGEVLSAL